MPTGNLAVLEESVVAVSSNALAVNPRALAWTCALLPFITLALWRATQGVGLDADDYAQYLMHARALLEGRPYSDIPYIASRYAPWIGPRTAPPGLPLVLALVQAVFGPNLLIMKAVMIGFASTFVLISAKYFARETDEWLGWGVALVCGLSPLVLQNAPQFLTDLPFAAAVWSLIYIVDRAEAFTWRKALIVTLLGAFAVMLRPTGIALGGALFLWALLHYRSHGWKPAVPLGIWAALLLLFSIFVELRGTAVVQLHPAAVIQWLLVEKLPLVNLREYWLAMLASHLYPFPWGVANDAFHAVTTVLMCIGLGAWLRRAPSRFAVLFAFCYLAMLLIMPLRQVRYIWPLYPLFVFGLLNGVRVVAARLWPAPARAPLIALAFALAIATPAVARVIAMPAPRNLEDVPAVRQVFGYVRTTAAHQKMRVTFFKPRTLAWATGVPAMGPPVGRPECLVAELKHKRITHVILGSLQGRGVNDLRRAVERWPALFSPQMSNAAFSVWRFTPERMPLPVAENCTP